MTPATRHPQAATELAGEAWRLISEMFVARRHRFVDAAASLDLTPGDLHTLLALEVGVPRAMKTLSGTLHCEPSNVTWLIDRLERRGLVTRNAHLRDRRVKLVQLTPAGEAAQEAARARIAEAPAELVALGTDDLAQLVELLGRVAPPPLPS